MEQNVLRAKFCSFGALFTRSTFLLHWSTFCPPLSEAKKGNFLPHRTFRALFVPPMGALTDSSVCWCTKLYLNNDGTHQAYVQLTRRSLYSPSSPILGQKVNQFIFWIKAIFYRYVMYTRSKYIKNGKSINTRTRKIEFKSSY